MIFLEKGLRIFFPLHFVPDFLRAAFLVYIAIVCFPGCDVINFEIDLVFLIKPFFFMTKKSK